MAQPTAFNEASPFAMVRSLAANRSLVWSLAAREIQRSYRGSYLGWLWLLVQPVALLTVYAFVFGVILQARFGSGDESTVDYALNLFIGLIVFHVFSECLNRAPGLIVGNVNYVKKIVFPIEIIAVVTLIAALYRASVSLFVWLAFYWLTNGPPQVTALLAPLILIPLACFAVGTVWIVSALGVYVRDLSQFVGILATATLFLSAIFYPISMVPAGYRSYLYMNPIATMVEQIREVAVAGNLPDPWVLGALMAASLVFAAFGFWWFQMLRRGFADVL